MKLVGTKLELGRFLCESLLTPVLPGIGSAGHGVLDVLNLEPDAFKLKQPHRSAARFRSARPRQRCREPHSTCSSAGTQRSAGSFQQTGGGQRADGGPAVVLAARHRDTPQTALPSCRLVDPDLPRRLPAAQSCLNVLGDRQGHVLTPRPGDDRSWRSRRAGAPLRQLSNISWSPSATTNRRPTNSGS